MEIGLNMELQEEIQRLKDREQKCLVKKSSLEAKIEERLLRKQKILDKLTEKGIDPDSLPQLIKKLEKEIQAEIASVSSEMDSVSEHLKQVEERLAN